ncbi:MAG: hypothetical protein LBM93_07370 [Oscillospiraceae bacterium]|jgi:hypothetical protein|nr:hypothetical protein [Oscillospiraceae bacterium]
MNTKINGNITEWAKAMLEKSLTPDEALEFLKDENNFRNPANGIPTWFAKYHPEIKENKVAAEFKKKMKLLFNKDESDTAKWLQGNRMPDRDSAIKILFALDLPKETAISTANEFMFKVCKWNGFNFRKVEDVVVCYALENGLPYSEVESILDEYKKYTDYESEPEFSDSTASTRHLENLFSDLFEMSRADFIDLLTDNKHNFIGYKTSAHRLFMKQLNQLEKRIKSSIDEYKGDQLSEPYYEFFPRKGAVLCKEPFTTTYHDKDVTILSEIIFDEILRSFIVTKNDKFSAKDKPVLAEIISNFPRDEYISEMTKDAEIAANAGYSRKTYILLFFANEVFKQEYALTNEKRAKISFYKQFYAKLNSDLLECGFGKINPADPYDWIILNCVRALDNDATEELSGTLELFNSLLHTYIAS